MSAALEISNLVKTFGGTRALDGMSAAVQQGRIVSLIGPNGAGKTTLFNVVCGYLLADGGAVQFRGRFLDRMRPHAIARMGIGRTFQDLRLLRRVTVMDNVMLAFQQQCGEGLGHAVIGWRAKAEEQANLTRGTHLLEFAGLADRSRDLAGALSYGQQKLLTLACCLAMTPSLLLLDEPVAGIEPEVRQKILRILQDLRNEGKAILLTEHDLEAVRAVSDWVIVMDEGRKIAEGTPEAVMRDPAVLEAYLT